MKNFPHLQAPVFMKLFFLHIPEHFFSCQTTLAVSLWRFSDAFRSHRKESNTQSFLFPSRFIQFTQKRSVTMPCQLFLILTGLFLQHCNLFGVFSRVWCAIVHSSFLSFQLCSCTDLFFEFSVLVDESLHRRFVLRVFELVLLQHVT